MKIYQKIFAGEIINLSFPGPLICEYKVYDTPFGKVLFVVAEDAVISLEFVTETIEKSLGHVSNKLPQVQLRPSNQTDLLWDQFQKNKDVPLLLYGTPFSLNVWKVLLQIPKGMLVSYQWISEKMNKKGSARAVGSAIGSNPIAWIVPCHRVIRKDGTIGGFFYGVELKKQLIAFEKASQTSGDLGLQGFTIDVKFGL